MRGSAHLKALKLGRGSDKFAENVQTVLQAFQNVADEKGRIEWAVLQSSFTRLRRYIDVLERQECIIRKVSGRSIVRFTLLGKVFTPLPVTQPAPKKPAPKMPKVPSSAFLDKHKVAVSSQQKVGKSVSTILYVDVPNICCFDREKGKRLQFLRAERASWLRFKNSLRLWKNQFADVELAIAYMKPEATKAFEFARASLEKAGFTVVVCKKSKDIDAQMITDIMEPEIIKLEKRRRLVVTVVSGDGDFSHALRSLKRQAQKLNFPLHTHIVSWTYAYDGGTLSNELERVADKVTALESILPTVDPVGNEQFVKYQAKTNKQNSPA